MDTPSQNIPPQPLTPKTSAFGIPVAIVIAGLLIGGAIIYSKKMPAGAPRQIAAGVEYKDITVEPVTTEEHILGSAEADVVFIEYSDTECPFCKQFHNTMHQVVDAYAKDGKVAWVYRNFPLYKEDASGRALHPTAFKEAQALECAAELGGNQKFWQYTDEVYRVTPSNNGLDPKKLPEIAAQVGLDKAAFNTCLESGKYASKIESDVEKAALAGGSGTPHIVVEFKRKLSKKDAEAILKAIQDEFAIIAPNSNLPANFFSWSKDNKHLVFSGALPYPLLDAMMKKALSL